MIKSVSDSGDSEVIPATGLLDGAHWVPSPNADERPPGSVISLLVVHGISLPPGEFGGPYIDQLFCNDLDPAIHPFFEEIAGNPVSSHLLIRRNGEIIQYVPFQLRAWHAGKSCFDGCECCNDFSIGIELEGTDEIPYEDVQYERLGSVARALMHAFPAITQDRIVGHCDIAPGRKTDPGIAFDWQRFRRTLHARNRASGTTIGD